MTDNEKVAFENAKELSRLYVLVKYLSNKPNLTVQTFYEEYSRAFSEIQQRIKHDE